MKDLRGYANVVTNPTMATIYEKEATQMGVVFDDHGGSGSTDMGDVSYVVPSIHPMYYMGTVAANHSRPFTAAAGGYWLATLAPPLPFLLLQRDV